ncbi:hypothetical protein OG393_31940 [Streptomyces sp. NBC_01216]|uniref:hypothetical protein n=1 Tax=Streptomyces sp. NBC_01216 TaxID=2903778 RepID=UPI002E134721|nr:hypothetical protein OG393_31940 [Streptomyces sp. NBC_01216]
MPRFARRVPHAPARGRGSSSRGTAPHGTPRTALQPPRLRSAAAPLRHAPLLPGVPARSTATPAGRTSGPLSSGGSVNPYRNAYWAQSDISVETAAPLTALTLEVGIAQTGGVALTGAWRTLPEEDFAFTSEEAGGVLVCTWSLKAGRTVPAGKHVFAVQYDHARGGRDSGGDTYTATGATAAKAYTVGGGF